MLETSFVHFTSTSLDAYQRSWISFFCLLLARFEGIFDAIMRQLDLSVKGFSGVFRMRFKFLCNIAWNWSSSNLLFMKKKPHFQWTSESLSTLFSLLLLLLLLLSAFIFYYSFVLLLLRWVQEFLDFYLSLKLIGKFTRYTTMKGSYSWTLDNMRGGLMNRCMSCTISIIEFKDNCLQRGRETRVEKHHWSTLDNYLNIYWFCLMVNEMFVCGETM